MTRMGSVTYLYFIIFSAVLLAACSAGSADLFTGRSARWDAYTKNKREKRSTANMEWQDENDHPSCTLTDLTRYDRHQRRANGALAGPQSQGDCGSCWAFAATHMFTDYLRLTGSPSTAVFSQDHMSKCIAEAPFVNRFQRLYNGCCGGSVKDAVTFLKDIGVVSETCLPYTLSQYTFATIRKFLSPLQCPSSCENSALSFNPHHIMGYQDLSTDAAAIEALDQGKPILAAMEVDGSFQGYRCGVFCGVPVTNPNHAVEIVDYSSSSFPGTPYWVVKNSWGNDHGEAGYFRIARGRNQLVAFATISTSTQVSPIPGNAQFVSSQLCSPQEPDTESETEMVESAAQFAVDTLQRCNLIRCPEDRAIVPTVTISSLVNDTIQIMEGTGLQGVVFLDIEGCADSTGAIDFVVDADLDDNFSLEYYRVTIGGQFVSRGQGISSNIAIVSIMIMTAFIMIMTI